MPIDLQQRGDVRLDVLVPPRRDVPVGVLANQLDVYHERISVPAGLAGGRAAMYFRGLALARVFGARWWWEFWLGIGGGIG